MISFVASSLDSVVVLSVQSVSGLGCGAGSVGKVWALDGLGGRWDSVASVYQLMVIESQRLKFSLQDQCFQQQSRKSSTEEVGKTV